MLKCWFGPPFSFRGIKGHVGLADFSNLFLIIPLIEAVQIMLACLVHELRAPNTLRVCLQGILWKLGFARARTDCRRGKEIVLFLVFFLQRWARIFFDHYVADVEGTCENDFWLSSHLRECVKVSYEHCYCFCKKWAQLFSFLAFKWKKAAFVHLFLPLSKKTSAVCCLHLFASVRTFL